MSGLSREDAEYLADCHRVLTTNIWAQFHKMLADADPAEIAKLKAAQAEWQQLMNGRNARPAEIEPSADEAAATIARRHPPQQDPRYRALREARPESVMLWRLEHLDQGRPGFLDFVRNDPRLHNERPVLTSDEVERLRGTLRGVSNEPDWDPWPYPQDMLASAVNSLFDPLRPAAVTTFRTAADEFEPLRRGTTPVGEGLEICCDLIDALCTLLLLHGQVDLLPRPRGARCTPTTMHLAAPPREIADAVGRVRMFFMKWPKSRFSPSARKLYNNIRAEGEGFNYARFREARGFLVRNGEIPELNGAVFSASGPGRHVRVKVHAAPTTARPGIVHARDERVEVHVMESSSVDTDATVRGLLANALNVSEEKISTVAGHGRLEQEIEVAREGVEDVKRLLMEAIRTRWAR